MRHEPNVMFNTFEEMKKVTSSSVFQGIVTVMFWCNLGFIVNNLQHSGIYIYNLPYH